MLTFDHVSFRYPGNESGIDNLSFHIHKGEFVSLIGSNGAGKSTISRLANGLLSPTSGTVSIDGKSTGKLKTSEIARQVGFLFQNPDRQICQNTVREELAFGAKILKVPADEIEKRVNNALEEFSLNGDWFPFSCSRGQRQRIALASVLVCRPEMVILDEPTTGLDYKECTAIMDELTRLNREEGLTVLMVSHDMELVQQYAKRVLVLTDGKLIGDGETRTIMKDAALLAKAHVLPAQIPELALRLDADGKGQFVDAYTIDEMYQTILKLLQKGEAV